jgi:hypothetical protein
MAKKGALAARAAELEAAVTGLFTGTPAPVKKARKKAKKAKKAAKKTKKAAKKVAKKAKKTKKKKAKR